MRIGVDARLLEQKTTGVGRVLSEIIPRVRNISSLEFVLFGYSDLKKYEDLGFYVVRTGNSFLIPKKLYSFFWIHFVLPRFIKRESIDCFIFPSGIIPIRKIPCKKIIFLFDVFHKINFRFQPFIYRIYLNLFLGFSLKNADFVITTSECSKEDIQRFFPKYKIDKKIFVMPLAAGENFYPREKGSSMLKQVKEKYKLPDFFALYAGVLDKRKNITRIIFAAEALFKEDFKIPIVLVGRPYGGFKKIEKNINHTSADIKILGHVSDKDIPFIFSLADFFIFPSLYEGFGLPPLEAMKSGIPVIVSQSSSLPEVVGDAGLYVNPFDVDSIVSQMKVFITNKEKRKEYSEKGTLQAKKFNWNKSAELFLEIIQRAIVS